MDSNENVAEITPEKLEEIKKLLEEAAKGKQMVANTSLDGNLGVVFLSIHGRGTSVCLQIT